MKQVILVVLTFLLSFNSFSQEFKEVSRYYKNFYQHLEIETETTRKFKFSGYVKIESDDKSGAARLWVSVINNDQETGFYDNMSNRQIVSNKWNIYEIEGTIDSNSRQLYYGGISINNGSFYFDKFELQIENDDGVYENVEIDNSSFEAPIDNWIIPEWSQGKSDGKIIRVKEFSVSSTTDAMDGNSALKFVGQNTGKHHRTIYKSEGSSPLIESMISMLEDLKSRVERQVSKLSQYELDHLHDEEANRIGALIMHLAAAEKLYQLRTFEGRRFNDEEKELWEDALRLDEGGRDKFKGHDVQYYLDKYNEVRQVTIEELRKRDDKWLEEIQPGFTYTNHYSWFHVMEHQSSHLGQILFLKKRIPPEPEIKLPEQIKN